LGQLGKMKFIKFAFFTAVTIALGHIAESLSYKNHSVVTFTIENEEQLKEIQTLSMEPGFVFWDPPEYLNMKIDLVIGPDVFARFEEVAKATEIDYKLTTRDLQSALDAEKKQRKEGFDLNQYNLLEDMFQFLDDMEAAYPEKATVVTLGESYEGRPIKGMKISTNENNPAVFIEANIHAREWISSATTLWMINEILTSNDIAVRSVVDSVTWYIVPVTNPDGYVYTHEENRLWRKTRSIHNLLCRGVDPNRNFGYNWRQGGSSNVACSDTYAGPTPFSENESRAMMDFYATVADKVDVYFCFHSAAQMLMYPLGNTASTENVPNHEDLDAIAEYAADALFRVYGTRYVYGNAMTTLYVTSGSSRDHAYGHFNTPLVFTYEMREGRGESIFILPPEEIHPNSHEIFVSVLAVIEKGRELNYFQMKG